MSRIIDELIRREGGYVNHPADRGGPTSFGITQRTLSDWRGRPVSAADVQALTQDEARQIYQVLYVDRPQLDRVQDVALRELLIDCAVNHGPARAVKWLQTALGVTPDGVIGPRTLAALAEQRAAELYKRVLAARIVFYGRLVTDDRSQAAFAAGWAARAAEFVTAL